MSWTSKPPSRVRAVLWHGLIVALAALASGCTSTQAFRPAEHASARSSSGLLAAEYSLRTRAGPDAGDVRVWSPGAWTDGGSDATVWQVGFEIDNESEAPLTIEIDRIYLDNVRYLGAVLKRLSPVSTEGDATIAPGSTGTFDATFRLPGVDPEDIVGFRVRWAVRRGRHRWSQHTPFIQAFGGRGYGYYYPPYGGLYPAYYYGPYYGPYYYGTYYGPVYAPGSGRRPESPAGRSRPPSFHPAPPPPSHR